MIVEEKCHQESPAYAGCVECSKRVRWEIDGDVIRGRTLDPLHKFLPHSISRANELEFLGAEDARTFSQVQGRTYANMFGLVERFINCKVLEISSDHWTGDQVALEALIRFSDEELKHQELFRRIDQLASSVMPEGYHFLPQPNEVAKVVLAKSTWAVLGLTFHIELFTQSHYRRSIATDGSLSPLFKDVFLYHWREEAQHANIDELEWRRIDAEMDGAERSEAVDDLIALVGAVDGILQVQADSDAEYFERCCQRKLTVTERGRVSGTLLGAYRWQYIVSGVEEPRFQRVLAELVTEEQMERIGAALAPVLAG